MKIITRLTVDMELDRLRGAASANEEDAGLWRWFAALVQDSRIRWCRAGDNWLVSVDHKHVATAFLFDLALRMAKSLCDRQGMMLG